MRRICSTFLALTLLVISTNGQEVWGLEKCVNYALDNNIQIKQSKLSEDQAHLNLMQSKKDRLPNLSGSASFQLSWGRNIDPITNVFQSQTLGFNSYSVNGGALIYNGNNLQNTIKRNELALKESETRTKQMNNDISLNVVLAYIQCCF